MIVKYDEDNFSIKLYRDFVKGKLVGLMEVIPIDELLEVWEKHKAEQTEPQTDLLVTEYPQDGEVNLIGRDKTEAVVMAYDVYKELTEPQTDCSWKKGE